MNVLIDTNVMLDYVLKREPFAESARDCIEHLYIVKAKSWLTASTITDIYYLTRRALKDNQAAKAVITKLLNAFHIAGVDKTDCFNALEINVSDYEDALVSVYAKKVKAQFIITRNIKDFQTSIIPAITPNDFLKKFSQ